MKWWWSPRRKRAWLQQEVAYRSARWEFFLKAPSAGLDPEGYFRREAALEELKPEGWTREIEARRWDSWNPRARRWMA